MFRWTRLHSEPAKTEEKSTYKSWDGMEIGTHLLGIALVAGRVGSTNGIPVTKSLETKMIGRHKRGLTGSSLVIADCITGATGVITDSEHF